MSRKNRFLDSSFLNGKCMMRNRSGGSFKEIPEPISLKDRSPISLLQKFTEESESSP